MPTHRGVCVLTDVCGCGSVVGCCSTESGPMIAEGFAERIDGLVRLSVKTQDIEDVQIREDIAAAAVDVSAFAFTKGLTVVTAEFADESGLIYGLDRHSNSIVSVSLIT